MNIQADNDWQIMEPKILQFNQLESLVFTIKDEKYSLLDLNLNLAQLQSTKPPLMVFTKLNDENVFIKWVPDDCKVKERMMFSLMKKDLVDKVEAILGLKFKQVIEF